MAPSHKILGSRCCGFNQLNRRIVQLTCNADLGERNQPPHILTPLTAFGSGGLAFVQHRLCEFRLATFIESGGGVVETPHVPRLCFAKPLVGLCGFCVISTSAVDVSDDFEGRRIVGIRFKALLQVGEQVIQLAGALIRLDEVLAGFIIAEINPDPETGATSA